MGFENGNDSTGTIPTYLIGGVDENGKVRAIALDENGAISTSGGSGGAGDASAANQVAGNTSLASIDTKTPALGQALATASTPVVLPTAQITALAPLSTVTANFGTIGEAATAALQTTGNTSLSNIGVTTDSAATTDTGTFSLIALLKRALQTLTTISSLFMPAGTRTRYVGNSVGGNLKGTAGTVYAITCSNSNASVRYFQLFQKVNAPVLNDVPAECFPVYPSDGLLLVGQDIIGGTGITLGNGVTWGFSTTRLTYTAGNAADCICTIRWV